MSDFVNNLANIAGNVGGNLINGTGNVAGDLSNNITNTVNNTIDSLKNNLLLLFEHPTEPVFMGKGSNKTIFQMPENFLPDRYKSIFSQLSSRFGGLAGNVINLKQVTLPDISLPRRLGRRDQFTLFIPQHRQMAGRLIDIFLEAQSIEDLQSIAVYCRENINPYLFNYAFTVALLHRNDTKDVPLPNMVETFPAKYFDRGIFANAREQAAIVPEGSRTPLVIPRDYTGTDLDPEHRVAYFREDIGINLHHWHWHLVYPFTANNRAIVDKDRRGELFYHMHHQMVARYNCERFCNRLPRVLQYNDFNQPIIEGYFPKLDSQAATRTWAPRFVNTVPRDINRPNDGLSVAIANINQWRQRLEQAIDQGFIVDANGNQISILDERGIDIFGNMIEASILSPNGDYYGDIHNMGHMLIAYCHDPDNRFLESFGIMGDSGTAMRDPIFYRLHAFIDEIFDLYKRRLPTYTGAELNFPGINVTGVDIQVQGGTANTLQTFWEQSDIDMSRGLDFGNGTSVYVRFTHLQHTPFTYRIQVNNNTNNQVFGVVRIFMAPRNDNIGNVLTFEEQRMLMIELDKFRVGLRQGQNTIERRSDESSVTISYERTFRNLNRNRPAAGSARELQFNFCGCGWPQHMLIPRGTEQGMPMDLYVIITNYIDDRIDQNMEGVCNDADSFCGVMNRRYPYRRPMGFPFDRRASENIRTLNDFLTSNMNTRQISINYTNRTNIRTNRPTATNTIN